MAQADKVEFNAQRRLSLKTILDNFSGLSLVSFSAVTRDRKLVENVAPTASGMSCGLFEFTKA